MSGWSVVGDRWSRSLAVAMHRLDHRSLVTGPAFLANQSVLDPAGPYAQNINNLFWFYVAVATAVFVIVIAFFVVAVRKGARNAQPTERTTDKRMVGIAVASTIVILFTLLVASIATGRAISPLGTTVAREINVIGHQWWWEVQYSDPQPSRGFTTANEIHLAAGERVTIHLFSRDVIHSLWIPNLHGKKDLIPGHETLLTLEADRPGVYRAQCAEFCGLQHAQMALTVTVEPKAQFESWLAAQRQPATPPTSIDAQMGQQLFLHTSCVLCHTIGGTEAGSRIGPDLTHIASRSTIGAGALPNEHAALAKWIANAQDVKPGAVMPPNNFRRDELEKVVAYLETLK